MSEKQKKGRAADYGALRLKTARPSAAFTHPRHWAIPSGSASPQSRYSAFHSERPFGAYM